MNHYEKGRHVPDIDTLRRMAAELNEERSNLIEALKTSSGVKHGGNN